MFFCLMWIYILLCTTKTLVQAFISSRLHYCNSVLYGVTDNLLQRLQSVVSVQNAAARLITRTGRREHISPVLQELNWLPVWCRVDFKLATLMFKLLHGCAPSYLSDACKSALEASCRLRSSGAITCVIRGPEIVWATCRLTLPNRGFGTSCLLHCGRLTVSANSEDSWKRFCLSRTRLRCLVTCAFRRQIQILLLTYLLTVLKTNVALLIAKCESPNIVNVIGNCNDHVL